MSEKFISDVGVSCSTNGIKPNMETWWFGEKGQMLGTLVLPVGITEVYGYSNSTLQKIIIPNGVKTICLGAFQGSRIQSLTIPQGVEKIDEYAFKECRSLTSVEIPAGCHVYYEAFDNCVGIESVKLCHGVKKISCSAFTNNEKLKNIYLPNTLAEITQTYYGTSVFSGHVGLGAIFENVTLENGFNCDTTNLGLSRSTKYSVETLVAMIEALADRTGETTQYTLKIGDTNKNKLSAEQRAVATKKNWTIS